MELDIPKMTVIKTQVNQMMRNVPQSKPTRCLIYLCWITKMACFWNYGTQAEADAELDKVRLARVVCQPLDCICTKGLGMKYVGILWSLKNHPKFPNLSPPLLVFKIKEPTKGAGSDIHLISLIGDELEESMLLYVIPSFSLHPIQTSFLPLDPFTLAFSLTSHFPWSYDLP